MAQTISDWECICVDDGSSDGSGAIFDDYARRDRRIKVVHKQNQGVSIARNVGKKMAIGKYLWFVDGDDAISATALERVQALLLQTGDVDFIRFRIKRIPDDAFEDYEHLLLPNGLDEKFHLTELKGELDSDWWRFHDRYSSAIIATNTIYKRELVSDLEFPRVTHGEDALFGYSALLNSRRAIDLDAEIYGCRLRMGSAQRSKGSIGKLHNVLMATQERLQLSYYANISNGIKRKLVSRSKRLLTHDNVAELQGLGCEGLRVYREAYMKVMGDARYASRIEMLLSKKLLGHLPLYLFGIFVVLVPMVRLALLKSKVVYKINATIKGLK